MRNIKRLFMKKLFARTFVVALGIIAAGAVVAWTGPTGTAPNNNAPAPINTTATTQTKTGILSSGDSFVAPNMTANQFCIGTSCVTSWGQAGGSATWASVTGKPYAFNQSADVGAGPSFGGSLTVGGQSVCLANGTNCPAGAAPAWAAITGKPFNWSGQGGQPTWLWGSNDGTNYYVWNPSNFSVSYANSAGAIPWSGVSGKPGNLAYWDTWYGSTYHASDGNIYLGWIGDWLSNRLNQAVTTNSTPQFSRVYDDNTAYYVDSNATSHMYAITLDSSITASSFLYSSDQRLKDNITPIKDALAKIVELSGVNFNWKSGARTGQQDVGVIAQEVQNVLPEAVRTDASGYLSVDYPKLVPLLIEAIKEQQAQISALKTEVDALRAGR